MECAQRGTGTKLCLLYLTSVEGAAWPKGFSEQVVPRKSRLMVCLHSQVPGWEGSLDHLVWLILVSQPLLPAGREVTLLQSEK